MGSPCCWVCTVQCPVQDNSKLERPGPESALFRCDFLVTAEYFMGFLLTFAKVILEPVAVFQMEQSEQSFYEGKRLVECE